MINEFDAFGRPIQYTSDGKVIERTEKGERIFEITYGDIEKVSTVTKGGVTTTTFRDVIRTEKVYWGDWEWEINPNQNQNNVQKHMEDFIDGA